MNSSRIPIGLLTFVSSAEGNHRNMPTAPLTKMKEGSRLEFSNFLKEVLKHAQWMGRRTVHVVEEEPLEGGPFFDHMWGCRILAGRGDGLPIIRVDFDTADVWQVPADSKVTVSGGQFIGQIGSVIFGGDEEGMINFMFVEKGTYAETRGISGLTELTRRLRNMYKQKNFARLYGMSSKEYKKIFQDAISRV